MNKFIIFDSIGSPLKTKTALFTTLRKEAEVLIFSYKDLTDGLKVDSTVNKIRSFVKDSSNRHCHTLVWNGSELGCNKFLECVGRVKPFLKTKALYIEQGFYPQKNNLRFCSNPVGKESYSHNGIITKRTKSFVPKNISKICFVAQLHYDTSLLKLSDPKTDISKSISELLSLLEVESVENLVICPHPKNKENYKEFIFDKKLANKISVSTKTTKEECASADLVIGWNSTFLLESVIEGNMTISLDPNNYARNVLTEEQVHAILDTQFNPSEIDFDDFIELCNTSSADFLPTKI